MPFMFENLKVYQRAIDLADRIDTLTETCPRGKYYLADQLNRAALSIANNLAEGNGRFTKADRKKFFIIARGSLQECVPALEICRRKQLISTTLSTQLRSELEEMSRMISGLIKGLGKQRTYVRRSGVRCESPDHPSRT